MYAVGHLALGYLSAKALQKALKTRINLPLVFLISIISDIDLLLPFLKHRSITHSVIVLTLASTPFLVRYRKTALPYFAALIQHVIIGDLLTNGGAQILWPLTSHSYGLGIEQYGIASLSLEWFGFLAALAVLARTSDLKTLFKSNQSNLLLAVPSGVMLVSMLIGVGMKVPEALMIPHIVFSAIFIFSILKTCLSLLRIQ